mmetsp:Transcript_12198/g.31033  ORF Transcript_12198/g.31033 Transcript_12198/m.31033 type:complete len:208 (-) Transcript_12198:131-754(-)
MHEEHFEVADVVDDELQEAAWQDVPSLLVGAVSDVGLGADALELPPLPAIDTSGMTPGFLLGKKAKTRTGSECRLEAQKRQQLSPIAKVSPPARVRVEGTKEAPRASFSAIFSSTQAWFFEPRARPPRNRFLDAKATFRHGRKPRFPPRSPSLAHSPSGSAHECLCGGLFLKHGLFLPFRCSLRGDPLCISRRVLPSRRFSYHAGTS